MNNESDLLPLETLGLCDVCQGVLADISTKPRPWQHIKHHLTTASFQAAVEKQCYICSAFEGATGPSK